MTGLVITTLLDELEEIEEERTELEENTSGSPPEPHPINNKNAKTLDAFNVLSMKVAINR